MNSCRHLVSYLLITPPPELTAHTQMYKYKLFFKFKSFRSYVPTFVLLLYRAGLKTFRRFGNSQQHRNNATSTRTMRTMHPIIMHQTMAGNPQNILGEPASMGGHIRAVKVTDCWYSPFFDDKSMDTSSGPAMVQTKYTPIG